MAFQFFTVPIHDEGEAQASLNAFLGTHKVLNVERRWVDQGSQSFWTFCVDYLPQGTKPKTDLPRFGQKERIDYKEKLPPAQFEVFSKLRDLRKAIRFIRREWSRGSDRVIRGGSWNNNAENCTASNRNWNEPDNSNNNVGFRLLAAPQFAWICERWNRPLSRSARADKGNRGRPVLVAQANAPGDFFASYPGSFPHPSSLGPSSHFHEAR